MKRKNLVHTITGVELVRRLASEGDRIFTTERARELAPEVGLSLGYLNQALHHLSRSGWIVRLRKGLYALSSSIPGVTPVHEFEIAMALVTPAAISHWSALHFHGLTDQVPRDVFIMTTTESTIPRHRKRETSSSEKLTTSRGRSGYLIGGTVYRFIQVKPEKYFGIEKVWVGDARVNMTDPERTLLDGLSAPQHFGDITHVLSSFETYATRLNIVRIIEYALRMDAAVVKRLGWVLERLGFAPSVLEPLAHFPVKGYRPLDPSRPRRGPCNRKWMIQENLPGLIHPRKKEREKG